MSVIESCSWGSSGHSEVLESSCFPGTRHALNHCLHSPLLRFADRPAGEGARRKALILHEAYPTLILALLRVPELRARSKPKCGSPPIATCVPNTLGDSTEVEVALTGFPPPALGPELPLQIISRTQTDLHTRGPPLCLRTEVSASFMDALRAISSAQLQRFSFSSGPFLTVFRGKSRLPAPGHPQLHSGEMWCRG